MHKEERGIHNKKYVLPLRRWNKGQLAEHEAAFWIMDQGYNIIHRNWRCTGGELDIVARYHQLLVVIEVRSRSAYSRCGTASESIQSKKIHKVRCTALTYMSTFDLLDEQVRFDVIAIELDTKGAVHRLEHIVDAF